MKAEDTIAQWIASGRLTPAHIETLARAFQQQNSLKTDGLPGPVTLGRAAEILNGPGRAEAPTPVPSPPPTSNMGLPNLALDPSEWLRGIDIDHHQRIDGALDLDLVRFAFVGVSEGTSGRASADPKFRDHLSALSAAGVGALGVYHFARPSSARLHGPAAGQPAGEAENFARQWVTAEKIAGKLLPPVLDMEDEKERLSDAELVDWTLTWCDHCTRLIGRRPIIYTYFHFIHSQLKGYADALTGYPLWLADYRGEPPRRPRDIPDWPWLFWQFTGSGTVPGISGQCDRNVFRGTRAQLEGLLL